MSKFPGTIEIVLYQGRWYQIGGWEILEEVVPEEEVPYWEPVPGTYLYFKEKVTKKK